MIHQHKARVYIQTTVLLQKSRCLAHANTVKQENQVHGNFTNTDWRKASNIINPLCTNKGYACGS